MPFDPDALLAALPKRTIEAPPSGGQAPRLRAMGITTTYNGFTGPERGRTSAVAAWLQRLGCMATPSSCSICGGAAGQTHAEDYFDLGRWIDICAGCHGLLHKRFKQSDAWRRRLDRFGVAAGHWARLISPEPFDLAALLKARGSREPTVQSIFGDAVPAKRRPRQRFGKMGIPPGGRLVHPMAPDEEVRVVDDYRLLWRGHDHSLASLTKALTQELGLPTSRDLWEFNGRSLAAIYDETYGRKAQARGGIEISICKVANCRID